MYEYIPQKTNKTAVYSSGALFLISVILMAFTSTFDFPYKWTLQLLAVICLGICILLLTRHVLKGFIYRVFENDSGTLDFSVTESQGKRRITVCVIGLSNIEEAFLLTPENKEELKSKAKGRKQFDYCPDISPAKQGWIFVTECGEKLLLKISPDEKLCELLGIKQ